MTIRHSFTIGLHSGGMFRAVTALPALIALAACSALPESAGDRSSSSRARPPQAAAPQVSNNPQARQCLAELGMTQASFAPLPDQYFSEGCSTLNTVKLSSVRSDQTSITLSNLGPVTCPVADAFAAWARFGVDRAARQLLGSGLRSIETMGSYSCRNVGGSGRRSAHASAAAVDIGAFVLEDGRRISVIGGWQGGSPAEREFLRVVHRSACKRFDTVLGPDYNSAHHDHIHVEGVIGTKAYCR
jgi:hypothetical protein